MPEFFLRKKDSRCFMPADEESLEIARKLDTETVVRSEAWKERNYRFLKKYFALLNYTFDNQDRYDVFEPFRSEVIMRAGYFNTHIHLSGQESFSPKSIAFRNMDEIKFEKLYSSSIDVILKYFIVGMSDNELRRAVDIVIGFC